ARRPRPRRRLAERASQARRAGCLPLRLAGTDESRAGYYRGARQRGHPGPSHLAEDTRPGFGSTVTRDVGPYPGECRGQPGVRPHALLDAGPDVWTALLLRGGRPAGDPLRTLLRELERRPLYGHATSRPRPRTAVESRCDSNGGARRRADGLRARQPGSRHVRDVPGVEWHLRS